MINVRVNYTADIIDKLLMYLKISIQGSNKDMSYRKEFVRTVIDVEKLFQGGIGHFIGQSLSMGLAEAADFELKFPFKRVITGSLCFRNLRVYYNYFLSFAGHLQRQKLLYHRPVHPVFAGERFLG